MTEFTKTEVTELMLEVIFGSTELILESILELLPGLKLEFILVLKLAPTLIPEP